MNSLINFCCDKSSYVQYQIDTFIIDRHDKHRFVLKDKEGYKYQFDYIGSGTYGNVIRVKNLDLEKEDLRKGESIIMKIMKVKHDEPERCLKIKKKIKKLESKSSKLIKNRKKLELVRKYATDIIAVRKCSNMEVIFLEYIDGVDLKDFINNHQMKPRAIELLYLQCLISVRVFHKVLRFAHRDLKLENLYFNKNTKNVQVIDYSFVCDREDKNCYQKNQGTAKYIHLKQNKIMTRKYQNKRGLNRNNSSLSDKKSLKTHKRQYNFPSSFSQDLFSLIIIIFKLYYENERKNKNRSEMFQIVKSYNDSFIKSNNKYQDKKLRYKLKNTFFKRLVRYEGKIEYACMSIVINVIKKYWNFQRRDFVFKNQTGDAVASKIIDELIHSCVNIFTTAHSSESKVGGKNKSQEFIDDIKMLDEI